MQMARDAMNLIAMILGRQQTKLMKRVVELSSFLILAPFVLIGQVDTCHLNGFYLNYDFSNFSAAKQVEICEQHFIEDTLGSLLFFNQRRCVDLWNQAGDSLKIKALVEKNISADNVYRIKNIPVFSEYIPAELLLNTNRRKEVAIDTTLRDAYLMMYIKDQVSWNEAGKPTIQAFIRNYLIEINRLELLTNLQMVPSTVYNEQNIRAIDSLISVGGYPRKESIGSFALNGYFFSILHSGRMEVYEKHKANIKKHFPLKSQAYIEDKMRVAQGLPQVYGTQIEEGSLHKIYPTEDLENLDCRRVKMGLKPIKIYLKGAGVDTNGFPHQNMKCDCYRD